MLIIDNGVVLDPDEFNKFFQDHCETKLFEFYKGDLVVGSITGTTNDNRFVLNVDIAAGAELYSEKFGYVKVTRADSGGYDVRLQSIKG